MKTFELTDDELDTLHDAFNDVGCDCPGVDWDKFKELGVKFGFWEAEKPPTEEELKRQKEFAESPLMVDLRRIMAESNYLLIDNIEFSQGTQWLKGGKVGSQVRIKLPNDYQVEEKK